MNMNATKKEQSIIHSAFAKLFEAGTKIPANDAGIGATIMYEVEHEDDDSTFFICIVYRVDKEYVYCAALDDDQNEEYLRLNLTEPIIVLKGTQ